MNVVVLQFPGTNCEYDTKYAFEMLGAKVTICWHEDHAIPNDTDLVVLPGGFSNGDYLRSGALAKFAPVMNDVKKFTQKGGKVLGICNGFQILIETGLLPGALKRNDNLHFISKHHHLKVVNNENKFLSKCEIGEVLNIPVAHHDGNFWKRIQHHGYIGLELFLHLLSAENMNHVIKQIGIGVGDTFHGFFTSSPKKGILFLAVL